MTIQTQTVDYDCNGLTCKGYMAWDDAISGSRPAVAICHTWTGLSDFEKNKAQQFAELGYVGFALDIFGEGKLGSTKEEKQGLIGPLVADRAALLERLLAGLKAMAAQAQIDVEKMAVAGYCFGGLCALDVARAAAPVAGAISYHGLLHAPGDLPSKPITSSVLVLHGYDDPMATPDSLQAFQQEMTEAGADWQVHAYGKTVHSFTNPQANDPDFGTVYSAKADRRSWAVTVDFLQEIFE